MPDVKQGVTQTRHVADFLLNGERLLEVFESGVVVAACVIDLRNIVECCAHALFVADFLSYGERLLEVIESGVVLTNMVVLLADLVQCVPSYLRVVSLSERGQPVAQQGAVHASPVERPDNPVQHQPMSLFAEVGSQQRGMGCH